MKRMTLPLSLAIVVTLAHFGIAAADEKGKSAEPKKTEIKAPVAAKSSEKTSTPTKSDTKKSEVVADIITFDAVPYFSQSRDYYQANDTKAAAHELIKAASMLDLASSWDSDKISRDRLATAAKNLREVGVALEKGGKVPSLKKLESAIAKAQFALAWHHYRLQGSTLEDLKGREANVAGHHLVAAARDMAAAAKWAGIPLGTEVVETVHNLDQLGDKLITEDGYKITVPEPSLEKFELELNRLGEEIESGAKLSAK